MIGDWTTTHWPVAGAGIAVALVLLTAFALPPLLGSLGSPEEDPAVTYRSLATRRFRLAVSLLVGAAWTVTLAAGGWATALGWLPLSTLGVVAAAIDARTMFLPRRLTLPGTVLTGIVVLALAAPTADAAMIGSALAGAAILGAGFWLLWRLTGGFGFGDVRLAFWIGLTAGATGLGAVLAGALAGSLIGVAWALAHGAAARRRGEAAGPFPYGPSLVIGPYAHLAITLIGSMPHPG